MKECLFMNKPNNLMCIMFFSLLENFDSTRYYSWGNASLAWLNGELYGASRKDAHDISIPLILL